VKNIMETLLQRAVDAEDAPTFMARVREGFETLHTLLTTEGPKPTQQLYRELDALCASRPRYRQVLELCAWPIFDKPALPLEQGQPDAFLWLFALPFTVRLGVESLSAPFLLDGEVFNPEKVLDILADSGVCGPQNRPLRALSSLYRRDDFQFYGPPQLCEAFVSCEQGDSTAIPRPLPVVLDAEIESCRTLTFYILCAARLPRDREVQLLDRSQGWAMGSDLAQEVYDGLTRFGLTVEHVESHLPQALGETLFRCVGPGRVELEANLAEARRLYGAMDVSLRYPMTGFAELIARLPDGVEIELIPAFSFLEPPQEIRRQIAKLCKTLDLGYLGAFKPAVEASCRLQ
jgi:hypothetical protein